MKAYNDYKLHSKTCGTKNMQKNFFRNTKKKGYKKIDLKL